MAKTKNRYRPNTPKIIHLCMLLKIPPEQTSEKVIEIEVMEEYISFDDIYQYCLQFVRSEGFRYEIDIKYISPQFDGEQFGIFSRQIPIKVQQIVQSCESKLFILILNVYEQLKIGMQVKIQELKKEVQDLKSIVDRLNPFQDNMELYRKTFFNSGPLMLTGQSVTDNDLQNLELDIGILFSQPLYNQLKEKPTLPAVDFRSEIERINMALKSAHKPTIVLRSEIATKQSLKSIIKLSKPKILHIICHGNSQGLLEFEEDSKNTLGLLELMSPKDLKQMLKDQLQDLPQLVFVNSCHSGKIGKAFLEIGVKNVIMINSADLISDEAAQIFSEYFYRNIFKTQSLLNCFEGAKNKVGDKQIGGCCCNHSSQEKHRPGCRWLQIRKKDPKAHKNYHVPSAKCVCQLKNWNRHSVTCQWARKVLFQINNDYRIQVQNQNSIQYRFPMYESQFPDYYDNKKRQLVICCCPAEKGKRIHSESNKFIFESSLSQQEKKQPFFKGPSRYTPEITDLTPFWLLEAHEKSKSIFGRQKELFLFLKQFKEVKLMIVHGKSGTGLTSFTMKVCTYMMERRVFEYFFFVDIYGIKDSIVFRYKFNEITKFQYDGSSINKMFVKKEYGLIFFDNCDDFFKRDPEEFYNQISTLLKQIPKCKIIITLKEQTMNEETTKNLDGRILCKKFELNPMDIRFAISYLNSKLKDKTELGVGYEEYQKLIEINSALRIPKVVESLSQSFLNTNKSISFQALKKKVKEIEIKDTNNLIEQVLNQLKEKSKQAFQFLIFVSQFADGITYKDLETFSLYVNYDMPVKKNWREHFQMLLDNEASRPKNDEFFNERDEPKLRETMSEFSAIKMPLSEELQTPKLQKKESDNITNSSGKKEELKNKSRESYFLQKNQHGKFTVKRFIRDYVWNKYTDESTEQMKFIYVAYFSIILEMLFQILKDEKYIHEELRTYSAFSQAGIFGFSTELKDSYEETSLTKSAQLGRNLKNDFNSMFVHNEDMIKRMKKTDPSTFIMNHKHDFLKIYDNNWMNLYQYLKIKNKGQQKIFLILFENLMVYIPTALKIAKAEDDLVKYVLRGSLREVEKFQDISQPKRSLIIQLKIMMVKIGMNLENTKETKQCLDKAQTIINRFDFQDSSIQQSEFMEIKRVFNQEKYALSLLSDFESLKKMEVGKMVSYFQENKRYIDKNEGSQDKKFVMQKMKQVIILSDILLKFLLTSSITARVNLRTCLNLNENFADFLDICKKAVQFFKQQKGCLKMYLRSELNEIELSWIMFYASESNVNHEKINDLRKKLYECEKVYLNSSNKLKGFSEFDDKIKKLKKGIKEKLWTSSSKRIIFLKSYPLATKQDQPIVKNLVRKKNNFRQQIQRVLTEELETEGGRGKKITLDVSTKYEILTSKDKLVDEAQAKCTIMFLTVDVEVNDNKVYFISENKQMKEQRIEINQSLANLFNMRNMFILVLSGVNTKKAMNKISDMSKNPPIIIALHSQIFSNLYGFGQNNEFDPQGIRKIVECQNSVKRSQLTYTRNFIKSICQTNIITNESVRKIHEQSMEQIRGERKIRCFIQMKNCKEQVKLICRQGQYHDLSPGSSRNHNIDQNYYDNNVIVRRWGKMPDLFRLLELNVKEHRDTTYINIWGETGCGKTSFIKEIAKIFVQRDFFNFGVYLFEGKKIENQFAGDFQDYIRKESTENKIPALEEFENLLGEKTVLIIDDFHLIKQRQNARMKMFLDKILSKKVNLILVSINELKLDFLPKIKKIKLQPLGEFQVQVLNNNINNTDNSDKSEFNTLIKYGREMKKHPSRIYDEKQYDDEGHRHMNRNKKFQRHQIDSTNMKKSNTTLG